MPANAATAHERNVAAPSALRPRVLESSPVHEAGEAHAYDAMVRRHGWLLNAPFVELVARAARGLARGRVLDIGSGPGRIPIALALRHPGWQIVGTDPAADMRAAAAAHAEAAGVASRVRFVDGTAERLPFESGSFDLVISHFALHHVARPERIAYLSCSAGTLSRNLAVLTESGYGVERITPYDFFPGTRHVETLVSLRRLGTV